jgi:hypothetical protein
MCVKQPRAPRPVQIAAYDNQEALAQADIEGRLRRRRRGAAANILTGVTGIPSSPTMGGVAQ